MAFTGIPSVSDIKYYINFVTNWIKRDDKKHETEISREKCLNIIKFLQILITQIKEIESFVVCNRINNDTKLLECFEKTCTRKQLLRYQKLYGNCRDSMKEKYNISSELFVKGIAFDYLENNQIYDEQVVALLKQMTTWNTKKRISSCDAMTSNAFNHLKINSTINAHKLAKQNRDELWFLQYVSETATDTNDETESKETTSNKNSQWKKQNEEMKFTALIHFELNQKWSIDKNNNLKKNYCRRPGCTLERKNGVFGTLTSDGYEFCSESCEIADIHLRIK